MLLSHSKRLCISSVFLISASPLRAAPTFASSPSSFSDALQQNVPSCAQSCIRSSLVESFSVTCTSQEDIACLCSHYNSAGDSLGEVAVGCVYSSCPNLDRIDTAYGVCLGQKEAVVPTKTALTYTVVASSTPRATSISSQRTTATMTSVTTTASQSRSSPTQPVVADTISTPPTATSVSASMDAEAPPRMTPAQIAGLSVAAVAAFVMAIGLMALSVCLRRRRERKFILDLDEKGQGQRPRKQSGRFSHYVSVENAPEPPARFPLPPLAAVRKGDKKVRRESHFTGYPAGLRTARPTQRPGVETSNSNASSDASLPLDQIGVAISAELDGTPAVTKSRPGSGQQQGQSHLNTPFRPVSTLTQNTVFEEDEIPTRRRFSMLLPTPPVPIAPIRRLQPSRPPPTYTGNPHQTARRSELSLDIPVRHERPQPKRINLAEVSSSGSPNRAGRPSRPRLAPPIQMTSTSSSKESLANTASSRNGSNDGDIIDYYFTNNQDSTPRKGAAHNARSRDLPKAVAIRTKRSLSTVSRTPSRASTNIRDSLSSQTSFETSDPNDTTPEDDDDDKQLSDDNKQQLSPVAESPISNLRYPKVPRSSNQLVPRSPRSPLGDRKAPKSPHRHLEPSTLLSKRNNALPPLLLESRPRLNSPARDPFTSPPRKPRAHVRSNSTESWTPTPASKVDRESKVHSGAWGMSPVMYEVDVVQPLNVRRKRDEMKEVNIGRDVDVDAEGLKSPVWVPHLTPTRKGDDLFISVGWGSGGRLS